MSREETVDKEVMKKDPAAKPEDAAPVKRPMDGAAPGKKPANREDGALVKRPVSRDGAAPEKKPVRKEGGSPDRKPAGMSSAAPARKPEGKDGAAPARKPADNSGAGPVKRPVSRVDGSPEDKGVKNTVNKKKKRRKKSKVLGAYFIYLAVLIILSSVILLVLWIKLADYQKGIDAKQEALAAAPTPTPIPKDETKEAQAAFEKYADNISVSDWTSLWMETRTDDPEDREAVEGYFTKALAEKGTSYYLDIMYDEETPVYKIKIGDKDAARLFMSRDMTGHWNKASVELVLKGDYEVKDELPSGMGLLINGNPAQPTEETQDHFPYSSIEDVLTDPVVWNVYDVKDMLTECEVSYENADSFIWSEDDDCYLAMADDVPTDDLMQRAEGFFKAYMNYTMSGGAGWRDYKEQKEAAEANGGTAPGNPVWGRFAACAAYTSSDSVAYSMLQKAFDSTCYGLAYTNHDYGLMETRGPIRWAGNCVGIDFFYHAYATINGQRKDYSGGDQLFRVFFINVDGNWKIWAFDA